MVNNHWIVNAALLVLAITLGFTLAVPIVLGVWGNPMKASATRSFVGGIETVAQRVRTGTTVGVRRATPALRVAAAGTRGAVSATLPKVNVALVIAARTLWLMAIALLVVTWTSMNLLAVNFRSGVAVLGSRVRGGQGRLRALLQYGWSKFRPVTQGMSLRRSTLREPAPGRPLASSRLAFAVIVSGAAFAVLIILTIRWVTAALEGIVS